MGSEMLMGRRGMEMFVMGCRLVWVCVYCVVIKKGLFLFYYI